MRLVFAVMVMLGMLPNASSAQQVLEAYRAKLAQLHDVSVTVHTVIYSNGVVADEYNYDWLWSPLGQSVRVRQTRSSFQGEFTALTHTTGNSEYYNGERGFVGLKDYDGVLLDGKVPADSPASAEIGPSRSYNAGMGQVDPWGEMGFYLIQPEPPSVPPWTLPASWQMTVGNDPAKPLCFKAGDRMYEISLDHEQNVIKAYRFTRPQGTIELEVIAFENVDSFGAFPTFIKTTLSHGDYTTQIETTVAISSVNVPLQYEQMKITLPEGVPFFNSENGKYGVWGRDAPAFYFESEIEARDWSRQRSIQAQANNASSYLPMIFPALIVSMFIVIGLLVLRKRGFIRV